MHEPKNREFKAASIICGPIKDIADEEGASVMGTIMATMIVCSELLMCMGVPKSDVITFLDLVVISNEDETEH